MAGNCLHGPMMHCYRAMFLGCPHSGPACRDIDIRSAYIISGEKYQIQESGRHIRSADNTWFLADITE